MAGSGGISDFLDLHANVFRRVRNLETGVHPTRTEGGLDDIYPPTSLTVLGGTPFDNPSTDSGPGWQRRAGLVQTYGVIEGGDWTAATEYHVINLPPEARPGRDTGPIMTPAYYSLPPFCYIRAQTDGKLYIVKPAGATNTEDLRIYLWGPSWGVDW